LRKSKLTEIGTDSGKRNNTKVVEYLDIFPSSVNTPSYDQWLRSYGLCTLRVLLKSQLWTEQDTWTSLGFQPTSNEKMEELEYRDHRAFHNLSNEW
jgi:hypothetical protein